MCGGVSVVYVDCSGNRIPSPDSQNLYSVDNKNYNENSKLEFDDAIVRNRTPTAPVPEIPSSEGITKTTALDGLITISGAGADRVANAIELLYEKSPTFAAMIDRARESGETVSIDFAALEGNMAGYSTLGAGNEKITLDDDMATADDETLLSVVSHELGHAFGDYADGPSGGVGDNQVFNSRVGYELGYLDTPDARPYGGTLWG